MLKKNAANCSDILQKKSISKRPMRIIINRIYIIVKNSNLNSLFSSLPYCALSRFLIVYQSFHPLSTTGWATFQLYNSYDIIISNSSLSGISSSISSSSSSFTSTINSSIRGCTFITLGEGGGGGTIF